MSQVPADEPVMRLAVDFVNTYDLREPRPERLSMELATRLVAQHGLPELASALTDASLMKLKRVRRYLYAIFAGETAADKLAAVNNVFTYVGAHPRVVDGPRLVAITDSDDPVRQLGAFCADALARALVTGGTGRIGTCAAPPCKCGFVDRTRAGRQRYCSELCNDRVAAANYRSRHAEPNSDDSH